MEQPDQQGGAPPDDDRGEDHREGPPGYDLDEQEAIEQLEKERQSGDA